MRPIIIRPTFIAITVLATMMCTTGPAGAQPMPVRQDPSRREQCGFDHQHDRLMLTDRAYRDRVNDFDGSAARAPRIDDRDINTYKVPVVFHIMDDGNVEMDLTDDQVRAAIRELNKSFRKVAGSFYDGAGVDMGIEFALAVRDPQGNCTTGITRTDLSWSADFVAYGIQYYNTQGMTEAEMMGYAAWDPTQYYNIYLVRQIDGGAGPAAFTDPATAHGSPTDGMVIQPPAVTGAVSRVFTHEMGHAFNLLHTYNGSSGTTCPANADCTVDGDKVCDTPPHYQVGPCTGTNSCTGGSIAAVQSNFMNNALMCDWTMFTAGQRTRAQLALTTLRASYLAANGNMSLVPPGAPQLDFSSSATLLCGTGQTVTFEDLSTCLPNTFLDDAAFPGITFGWSLSNGINTYTSSARRPTFTLGSTGTYNMTLTVTTSLGTYTRTENGVVVVANAPLAGCTPPTSQNIGNFAHTVNNVTFNTINNSTNLVANAGYTDYACTNTTMLIAGGTYPMSVSIRSSVGLSETVNGYIDYNNNGVFEDPSERVITGSTTTNAVINANVTIPGGVVTNTLLRMRIYGEAVELTADERNCASPTYIGDIEDYGVYIASNLAAVSIAASPGTTITYGTNVTFTPTPVNGGSSPVYTWYRNGVPVGNGATYQSNNLLPGETIQCEMASNLAGVIASPALSNTLTMTVTGPPVSDFTSTLPRKFCSGGTVTYTDASLLSPTSWAWTFPGGTPSSSTAQNPVVTYNTPGTYSVTLTATNASGPGTTMTKTGYITVFTAPAAACTHTRTGSPNTIGIVNVTLNTINNSTTHGGPAMNDYTCSEITVLQASTPYAISVQTPTAQDQWLRVYIDYNNNGLFTDAGELVFAPADGHGTISGTITTPASPLQNTLLRMRVISDYYDYVTPGPCTNVGYGESEDYGIYFTTSAPVASVSIAASPGSSVPSGTMVTFTPTPVNGGSTPTYQWFRNNAQVGTGATYQSNTFTTGDAVYCLMTSNLPGVTGSPATSNTVTMTVSAPPCTAPTATATPTCAGSQFNVGVNLTSMGSATSIAIQVDNDAGGPNGYTTVQTVTGTGNYGPFGPYASGQAVNVRLVHNIDTGCNLNLNNVVATCNGPGSGCVYSSTAPTNILDLATVSNSITVPSLGGQVITDLNVFVNITHTYIGDLLLSLQSPMGTTIALISNGVCGSAQNMTVEFDQQAASPIGTSCPLTNLFCIPAVSLAGFNGQVVEGTWTLSVQDAANGDIGTLNSWCLIPQLTSPPCTAPTATATPTCAGSQFNVNVDLTSMGNATSIAIQVDNDAGGPNGYATVQTVTGTGNYGPFGPYSSGQAVNVRLVHNSDAGCNLDLNNVVATCGPGANCAYSSTTTTNILDNTTVSNTITVPALGGQVITDLNVYVNLTHTYTSDLRLTLLSPGGVSVPLINTGVCSSSDDMTVEFDQQAASAIGIVCPMANIYAIPSASLDAYNGQLMEGMWTLSIQDMATQDQGVLNSWCLIPTLAAGGVQVAAKVMLQGPYDATTGLMSDALRSASLLPSTEPYSAMGHTYTGSPGAGGTVAASVFTTTGNNAIVDWVVLELRNAASPAIVAASCAALVQRDGDIVALDGTSPVSMAAAPGQYHIAVRHRNHLGVMTNGVIALSSTPTITIDLSQVGLSMYGTNARKSISGTFPTQALWAGDVTFNGQIKYAGGGNDRDPILVRIGG
ncbi:MAG TPA: proprotein convertase P-domain-containing protein, partial [Flavobacteriales bacterium]|nr:proprotein convertase P-domain-containing protein [Flavobacteriales bacterium]HMR29214.1 proprotein convertase P-domain-containing protein [Flavobacteriales bacterium]